MADMTVNLESLGRLAEQMTTAAAQVAAGAGAFDDLVEQRVAERLQELRDQAKAEHEAVRDQLETDLASARMRADDLAAEMRRQLAVKERMYERAAAALRESGRSDYGRAPDGVEGEPPASDPAAQVVHWLDGVVPPWPADRMVFYMGDLMAVTNLEGDRRGYNADLQDLHPNGASRTVPVGALVLALKVVAAARADQSTGDTLRHVRNLLIGYGVPGRAEHDRDQDAVQAKLRGLR